MNWVSDLLRQVTLSKTLTSAVFFTSATLLFGPRLLPGVLEPLPRDWQFVPAAGLVFSACFLLAWIGGALWRLLVSSFWHAVYSMRSRTLDDQELEFLSSLAKNPDTPINLRTINYETSPLSRFEFTRLASSLERKGLVRFGPHERAIVILTSRGERVAVKAIEREKRAA